MQKAPKWLLILAVITVVCTGVKLWYDNLCSGKVDISDSAPSKEMLLHIIEHADELAAREDLFSVSTNEYGDTTIRHIDYENMTTDAYMMFGENSAEALRTGSEDIQSASGSYTRMNHSDFCDMPTPWSRIQSRFLICTESIFFAVVDTNAVDTSDAPLRRMMSAIESVIGTP